MSSVQHQQSSQADSSLKSEMKQEVDLDQVRALIEHLFSSRPPPISHSTLNLIHPNLVVSLPYFPHSRRLSSSALPPTTKTLLKELALFHFPTVAVESLPRASWDLEILQISRSSSTLSQHNQQFSDQTTQDEDAEEEEVYEATLQWTLRIGSSFGTPSIPIPHLPTSLDPFGGANHLLDPFRTVSGEREGEASGGGEGRGIEDYDAWSSVGSGRSLRLVFSSDEDVEDSEKSKDENKERTIGRKTKKTSRSKKLVYVVLSPTSNNLPVRFEHLIIDKLPHSIVQPLVKYGLSKLRAIFVYVAFGFIEYLGLDRGTSRLRVVERGEIGKGGESVEYHRHRSHNVTLEDVKGYQVTELSSHARSSHSSHLNVKDLHVDLPLPSPDQEEREGMQTLRRLSHGSDSIDRPTTLPLPLGSNSSDMPLPSPRIRETLDLLAASTSSSPPPRIDTVSISSLILLPLSIITALIVETIDLYHLIARLVVFWTEIVLAVGEMLKQVFVLDCNDGEEVTIGTTRGRGRSEEARDLDWAKATIVGSENQLGTPIDNPSITSASSTTIVSPQPRLHSKRVSFSSLRATVIESSSSPSPSLSPNVPRQVESTDSSLPDSPVFPQPPPPSVVSPSPASFEEPTGTPTPSIEFPFVSIGEGDRDEDEKEQVDEDQESSGEFDLREPDSDTDNGSYSTLDPQNHNLPSIATSKSPLSILHFRTFQKAAEVASTFTQLPPSSSSRNIQEQLKVQRSEIEDSKLYERVGKECAKVAKSAMGDPEELRAIEDVEREIEEKLWRNVEEILEGEKEGRRGELVGDVDEGESQLEEEDVEVVDNEGSQQNLRTSASDYPTPSSRLADEPIPTPSASFDPASPSSSSGSTPTYPLPSPGLPIGGGGNVDQSIDLGGGGVREENKEEQLSPPTSPEISTKGNSRLPPPPLQDEGEESHVEPEGRRGRSSSMVGRLPSMETEEEIETVETTKKVPPSSPKTRKNRPNKKKNKGKK